MLNLLEKTKLAAEKFVVKKLAEAMGKSLGVLYNKLDPACEKNHLTLADFVGELHGKLSKEIHLTLEDGEVTKDELERINNAVFDLTKGAFEIRARLDGMAS